MYSRIVPGIACSIALGLCLAQAMANNDRWAGASEQDLSLKGGTSRPYSSSYYIQTTSLACGTSNCYNAGGHDFKCQDQSKAYTTTSSTSGSKYTTTKNTACTPLYRYNSVNTTCVTQDTTFSGDCNTSKTLYTDP